MDAVEKIINDMADAIAERVVAKLRQEQRKTYTLKEAAEVLNLSTKTVYRMIEDGRLRRLRGTAKNIIPAHEIDKLLHGK